MELLIIVGFEDESDFDFARAKCVGAVEELLNELDEEGRLDGKWTVDWEVVDKIDGT
jgi:hypothetical protein